MIFSTYHGFIGTENHPKSREICIATPVFFCLISMICLFPFFYLFIYFFMFYFIFERESVHEHEQGKGRETETKFEAGSRLRGVGTELDLGFALPVRS